MISIKNPSGVSDIQRKRLTFLIEKHIIPGSAEGICLLTYDEAQEIIDNSEGKDYISKMKRVEEIPDAQDSGNILSQFEIDPEPCAEIEK